MSPPPPHEIPTDVLYEILLQYGEKNLSFLWLNCRPVSRNFKDAVERVFVTKHLKKTWLHVDIGRRDTDVELQFYGLDPTDSARAIFESCVYQDYLEWEFSNGPSLEFPHVIIQIRHEANDTMLPDFRYEFNPDPDIEFEVSFDWKAMYSHFFQEQREAQRRLDECYRSIRAEAEAARVPFFQTIRGFRYVAFGVDHIRIGRTVRSERIRRNVLENEGKDVSGDDHPGFEKLESKKRLAILEDPYSDESCVEDDGDEDGDEDEDGEHEDRAEDDASEEAGSEEDNE
ncbi:uncharacterized protein ARMOST_02847 [Armillaria ostoyae]|uniref:Uncharacterized protein n=1 Tax=Armillaria ostoyae TaxID=47428 RepID=A0A284QSS8_ARMOS|nr:uncharacterized protein ARMOST_02847 [Armillaria ostoyae]